MKTLFDRLRLDYVVMPYQLEFSPHIHPIDLQKTEHTFSFRPTLSFVNLLLRFFPEWKQGMLFWANTGACFCFSDMMQMRKSMPLGLHKLKLILFSLSLIKLILLKKRKHFLVLTHVDMSANVSLNRINFQLHSEAWFLGVTGSSSYLTCGRVLKESEHSRNLPSLSIRT